MADLEELNYDDLDELDIETLLARVERKPLTFSRKQNLKQAPEFMQRLSGKDTVEEGEDTQLECVVCAFPRPDLTWYKDSDLILPDHPRMTTVEGEEGKYFLKIKNVCKGDEAGYKCKAENCEGTSASTFFLFVNVKPKRTPKNKRKRRRVSYPPMFSTIVEKVEEEEVAAKEARFAPPSPLSELYVGITLKSRHTWPKFLGEWAFAEDAIRSCSDEAESPPTSPDGTEEKINVKIKVSNKPVKSILKTRRRPEERETSEDQKQPNDQSKPKDAAVTATKKTSENGTVVTPSTTSANKTSTKRTESKKTTTTTTTTTTKTTKTTSTTKTNGKSAATTDSGQALVSSQPAKPAVTTKSETKELESKQQDAISLKGTEKKTTTNGSAITTTTASTTKNNTRTLTAHRIEETRQTVKQQVGGTETKTSPSGAGPGKPSPQEQVAVKKAPTLSQTKPTQPDTKDSASPEEKKPLSKTQSLQERLIKKTTQTSTASAKKISTGSLGISRLTERLTGAPATQKDNVAVKTSPTKDIKTSPTKVIATTSATGQKASSVSQSSTLTTSSSSMKSVTQTTKSTASNGALRSNGPLKSLPPTSPPTTTASVESPTKQLTPVNHNKQPQVVLQPSPSLKQPTQQPPPTQKQPQTAMTQKTTTTQQTQVTQKLTTSQTATIPKTAPLSQTATATVPKTTTTSKSTAISSSATATTQSTTKSTEVQKPATLSLKANEVRSVEASPTKLVPSPSTTPAKSQIKLAPGTTPSESPTQSQNPSPTPIQNQTLKGNGQALSTTPVTSPVVELPVTHQTSSPHNMALPGKPTPESNDPKYKTTALIKTTQQNQVASTSSATTSAQKVTSATVTSVGTTSGQKVTSPTATSVGTASAQKVTSPTATTVETGKAPRFVRQESVGMMVVNKLVVDQRNQDGRRRRERSPAITHTVTATVRSRETSPATQRTRVRRERGDRGKSPIMQLLPTDPRPKSPVTSQPSVPSPVRYLPIISVKERPSEQVLVHQPTVASSVIDLRGIGNAKTGEIQQPTSNVVVQRSVTSQPVEFVKPYGAGKDPIQGLKQTFTTQEMQTQKAETSCDDPKAGIKRSISMEKLHLIDRNTDVIASAIMGPVGAKAAVVDTDVIRTKLITEQPAVPSDRVQPGLIPVQATQKEILTKETTRRTIMEVGKNNLPKGTVMIAKPGSVATTKMIEAPTRKASLVESLTNRYNTSTPSSGSSSPSYLGTSRSPSRSPSPNRMLHSDNSWQSKPQPTSSPQPTGRSHAQLHFKPIDSTSSPQIVLSPGENQREIVLGGSSWNTRPAPLPPKRGSSVERMLTTYSASPSRKTSLQFTPYFSRTEPKKPVDITQYLGQGQGVSRMDRSRRAQSEDRLPSIPMYPSRGAMSPPQRPPPPNWSFAAPLNRSVSVDVIPGLVESDRGFSTYQEIPVEHLMSPDSAATLPRRRKRRNSVELLANMFDGGTPAPVDASQSGTESQQYQDMGQQLLTQIQAFGDASYDFEEGSATLPRTKDSHGGPRLKRRNSVGHMAKIFDQGIPVVQKGDDAIPIYGGSQQCLPQALVNVVHPYSDTTPHNSRPPEAYRQPPVSSRLSASTPHLPSSMSKSQPQNLKNPVANQSRTSRAAACSLNLKHVAGVGSSKNPSVLNQRPTLQRSLSQQPQSPQRVTLRQHPAKSAEAEEVVSYKRLSVGEAARLFDQKSPESPPQRKNPSLAQKFLAKFK